MRWAMTMVVAMSATGCFKTAQQTCASGLSCPPGLVCSPTQDACVEEDQVAACAAAEERDLCTYDGPGLCLGGVCVNRFCGDGLILGEEVCEANLEIDGDCVDWGFDRGMTRCSSDCQRLTDDCTFFGIGGVGAVFKRNVSAISGTAPDRVFAATGPSEFQQAPQQDLDGYIFQYDLSRGWNLVYAAPESISDMFVAAQDFGVASTFGGDIVIYDGVTWDRQATVIDDSGEPTPLHAAWADNGQGWVGGKGYLYRWSAELVEAYAVPDGGVVDTIWGRSGTDLYLLSRRDPIDTMVWHFDGATMEPVVLPQEQQGPHVVLALHGTDTILAVSTDNGVSLLANEQWTFLPTSFLPIRLSVFSAEHIYAAATGNGLHRFDGTQWFANETVDTVSALWAADPWTVYIGTVEGQMGRFDGTERRSAMSTALEQKRNDEAISLLWSLGADHLGMVTSEGHVIEYSGGIVGDSQGTPPTPGPYRALQDSTGTIFAWNGLGTTLEWAGADWQEIPGPTPITGIFVHGSADQGTFYLIQSSPEAQITVRAAGSADQTFPLPEAPGRVLAASPSLAYIAFDDRTIREFSNGALGTTWQMSDNVRELVASHGEIYALVGAAVFQLRDGDWGAVTEPLSQPLVGDFAVNGPADIYRYDPYFYFRRQWHWQGSSWERLNTPGAVIYASPHFVVAREGEGYDAAAQIFARPRPWGPCAASETACADGVDNDCDGSIDNFDDDCGS